MLRVLVIAPACLIFTLVSGGLYAHPAAHEALAHFSRQLDERPRDQSLYIQRGIVYSNDGQYPQAQADFQRAAELGDPVLVAFDFGVLEYRRGSLDIARRHFDAFLGRFPNHVPCLEYRARVLRDAGDYEAAVADFRRVFELHDQPNPGHFISTAQMLQSRDQQGIAQALAILDQGNQQLGLTPQLQRYAIQLELRRNQPDNAVARMLELESMLGASPDWKVDMAGLVLRVGKPEQAIALLDEASLQLDTLRSTPARLQLRERIDLMRATMR